MTHQNHHYEGISSESSDDEKLSIVENETQIDFEYSQNDYNEEGISIDDESMEVELQQPMEKNCRLFTKEELPSFDHHTMKYFNEQIAFGSDYFGIEAINTSTWSSFKEKVRVQIIKLFHDLLYLG